MARSIWINSLTGDYETESGSLLNANTLLTEGYVRLAAPKGGWMYAPDNTFGSDLYKFFGKRSKNSNQALLQTQEVALRPLLTSQRVKTYTVTPTGYTLGRYAFNISMTDQVGELIHFNYSVE